MVDPTGYYAAARDLVRWWVGTFGLLASAIIAWLGLGATSGLGPLAGSLLSLLLILGFGVAIAAMLGTVTLYKKPRSWSELSATEQSRHKEYGVSASDYDEMARNSGQREALLKVRELVVGLVSIDEAADALSVVRRRLKWAAIALVVLMTLAAIVKLVGADQATCSKNVDSCASAALTAPTKVRLVLARDADGDLRKSTENLRRLLSGAACSPTDGMEALAVGGTWVAPVVQLSGPTCYSAPFLLGPEIASVIPMS